jgi:hypothetical protein
VTVLGNTLSYGGHSITPMTTTSYGDASSAGSEQFGVNLVANTSPVAVGANPSQYPDSTFSFGVAGDGTTGTYGTTRPYTVDGRYRFSPGETIASGPKSSGRTDYTMSFLVNISTLTPGGRYTGNVTLVATGTY